MISFLNIRRSAKYISKHTTDITDLRAVQKELQENLTTLQNITDNMLDMVSFFTIEGEVVYVSPSCEFLIGHKPELIIGRNMIEFVHPDDREYALAVFAEFINTQSPRQHELRLRTAGGRYIWTETIGKAQKNDAGEITGIIINTRDITDRKKADKTAADEQMFLNTVLDNIKEAIIICDQEGKIIRFNESARKLHNLPEEPIPADQWAEYYDLYYADGSTLLAKEDIPLFRALKGDDVVGLFPYQIKGFDNRDRPFRHTASDKDDKSYL